MDNLKAPPPPTLQPKSASDKNVFWRCSLSNGNEILISSSDLQFKENSIELAMAMAMKNFMIIYVQ